MAALDSTLASRRAALLLATALGAAWLVVGCPAGTAPDGPGIGHSRAGLGCYTDSQCGLDACNTNLFPGGACVGTCDDAGSCPDDPDAGPPQVCMGAPDQGGCLRGCELDGGCIREGWICQDGPNGAAGGGRVCLPDCRSDGVLCTSVPGTECSISDGICRVSISADAGLYGACGGTEQCANSASCLSLDGQAGDGGYCTVVCHPDDLDAGIADSCRPFGRCLVAAALEDGGSESFCAQLCSTAPDAGATCSSGLSCQEIAGGTLPDGGILPLPLCAP